MLRRFPWFKKGWSIASTSILYVVTLGFLWYVLLPAEASTQPVHAMADKPHSVSPPKPEFKLIYGKPVRIVISDSNIDLPIDEGYYDENTGNWTLSDTHAQYAMMSVQANNLSGNTFIYGHGIDEVFGKLGSTPPTPSSTAQIYTDNGHVFSYTYQSTKNLTPNDTSVLDYSGPPILTLQTCTGSVSEWRSMFQFTFVSVIQ